MNLTEALEDLTSSQEETRAYAAEEIGLSDTTEAAEILARTLYGEASRFVREVIISALKGMSNPAKDIAAIEMLHCNDAFVRNAGIEILASSDSITLPALEKLLHDPDKDIRKFCLDVLVQLNNPEANGLIAAALHDSDINVIITAVEYLARFEAHEYADMINQAFLRSTNNLLTCTCMEALAAIGNEDSAHILTAHYLSHQEIEPMELCSFLKFLAKKGTIEHLSYLIQLDSEHGQWLTGEIIMAIEGILLRSHVTELQAKPLNMLIEYVDDGITDVEKRKLLNLLGRFSNPEVFSLLRSWSAWRQ